MSTHLQINLPTAIYQQAEVLAKQLSLKPDELIALALENFLHGQHHPSIATPQTQPRDINQGEI